MYRRKDQRLKEKGSKSIREKLTQSSARPIAVDNFVNSNLQDDELKPRARQQILAQPKSCKAGSLKIQPHLVGLSQQKRINFNHHQPCLNQYPFLDFNQRKASHDATIINRSQRRADKAAKQSLMVPDLASKAHSKTLTSAFPKPQRKRDRVTFWAGLRIEGNLSPFEIKRDEHSKWHVGIANGQLFEKIGGPAHIK